MDELAAQKTHYYWTETAETLRALLRAGPLLLDEKGKCFISPADCSPSIRFEPPPLLPLNEEVSTPEAYLATLAQPPDLQLLILLQAGATSIGLWRQDALICHKVIKKYVTRGKGKAQTTYLKTKGKSRYGARLRLQNARDHLNQTNEKLHSWWSEHGAFTRVYYSCPKRLWPELFAAQVTPPFSNDAQLIRIKRDVRVPGHQELLKIRGYLCNGVIFKQVVPVLPPIPE